MIAPESSPVEQVALRPCPNPWCNSLRADRPEPYVRYYESGCYFRVNCDVCPQIGPSGDTKTEAITAWNTRARTEADQRVREALELVIAHFDPRGNDGNAPGHAHDRPGIWDDDLGNELAGRANMPCEWCATWTRARAALTGSNPGADGGEG